MQESGRAGRDGAQSIAFLLYQGMQPMHVDKNTKDYVKSKGCRRKHLLNYFDVECPPLDPAHLCCDNCSVTCKCGLEDCKPLCYPQSTAEEPNDVPHQECNVSLDERKKLKTKLVTYHKLLLTNFTKRDASGKLKYFTHPKFMLGCRFNKYWIIVLTYFQLQTFAALLKFGICSMHSKFMESCRKCLETCKTQTLVQIMKCLMKRRSSLTVIGMTLH